MRKSLKLGGYDPSKKWETPSGRNAGDYFGKGVLDQMGYSCEFNDKPDIITCGSILGRIPGKCNPYVGGSGFHNEGDKFYGDISKIKAVRGKLTYDKLETDRDIVLGDPGLLASYFYKPVTSKKHKYGIIPHYTEYRELKEKYRSQNVPVINIATDKIKTLLNQINECEFIFSSSLHGIIFAHSLGIPAIHVENKELYSKNNFKFKDYYSALDIEYVKESFNEIDFSKYINDDGKLYKPNEKELKTIQNRLLSAFPYQTKVAICAVAKCENDYINDGVKYHLDLGVDQIYIGDNNDVTYEDISLRIDKEYEDRVHIYKVPGAKDFQISTYNSFYNTHKDEFDWMGFFDIDEFITLKKGRNIKEFLNDTKFEHYNVIKLNGHLYGDDDLVERDMSIPVYEGITHRLKGHKYESHGKEFIRGKIKYDVNICSNHWCTMDGRLPMQIMPDGKPTTGKVMGTHNCEEAYVAHYMTKTISEFINQKLRRRTDASFSDRVIGLEYFGSINKKTPEKLKYIKDHYG